MDAPTRTLYQGGVSRSGAAARILAYRDCLALLAARAVKVRYRGSVLGFGWSLLYPLSAMLILTAVFSRVFVDVEHYPLYVIVGFLAWGFFSLSCVQAMDALLGAAPVLRKVYVPSALFPLAAVFANMVNLLLSILILPVVMWTIGAAPGFHPLWLVVGLLVLLAFTTGCALALAALNVFFHDVRYFFEAGLLIWFYATPIVYPAGAVPARYSALLKLNPLYWVIEILRAPLYAGAPPSAATLGAAALWAAVSLLGGWLLFTRLDRRFYLYL
jgi:ABC-type polysaccharide/polyol phosphate export permease